MIKYDGVNSNYDFSIDNEKNIFYANASGYFTLVDGESYIRDFEILSKLMPANSITLIINVPELKPSSPEVAVLLIEILKIYAEFPFKQRFVITNGNLFTIMQVKRLGATVPGWSEGVQYLDNIEEVLKRI